MRRRVAINQNPTRLIVRNVVNVKTVVFDLTQINPQNGMRNTKSPTRIANGRQSPHNRQKMKLVSSRRFPSWECSAATCSIRSTR